MKTLAQELAPKIQGKTVTVGVILEKSTQARYQLSDALTDEITTALQNQQIAVFLSAKDEVKLKAEWVRLMNPAFRQEASEKIGKLRGAELLGMGSFYKWGKNYKVSLQMVDTTTGEILGGSNVTIDGSDVPEEMLRPVVVRKHNVQIWKGLGRVSIRQQCSDEQQRKKTCPPRTELKRRALTTAKMYAMQDIIQQTGVDFFSAQRVLQGRLQADEVTTESGGQLMHLEFAEPQEQGDELSIELIAEVKTSE